MEKRNRFDYRYSIPHYSSSERRDNVKLYWEESVSKNILGKAIGYISKGTPPTKLKILDLGCGAGDGLNLINLISQNDRDCSRNFDYFGQDLSMDLLSLGHKKWVKQKNAHFFCGDFTYFIPESPFNIYFSTGAPFSHITPSELLHSLELIFSNIKKKQTKSVVIIDVLGRYSIEWINNWGGRSWNYQMNFFSGEDNIPSTKMYFYSGKELIQIIQKSLETTHLKSGSIELADRSIMVGRHTTTGQYSKNLPNYRNLINNLIDRFITIELESLKFQLEIGVAPKDIIDFFEIFSMCWNQLIDDAIYLKKNPNKIRDFGYSKMIEQIIQENPEIIIENAIELVLARQLRDLEFFSQQGLGVGHSLIAAIYL